MSQRWVRSAEISRNLIVALVVLVIAAGAFWGYKAMSSRSERAALSADDGTLYKLSCPECKKSFEYTRAQGNTLAKQKDASGVEKFQCPECKKFVCFWGELPKGPAGGPVP